MTVLQVNLSAQLQATLEQEGVWAYAVYFDSSGTPQWTPLVDNGTLSQPSGSVAVDLPTTFNSGKVYFLIQSQDSTQPYDLETLITAESNINWDNAQTYSFRYDSFEVSLTDAPGDAGNLTSVEGFGLPMDLSITYSDGTTDTRGYKVSGSDIFQDIAAIDTAKTYTYAFTQGPLQADGVVRAAISPSQAVGLVPANPAFEASDWNAYVQSLEGEAAADVAVAGFFNGAPDANGVYHNAGFFAYQLEWDADDEVFWLNPTANSEIQGYIKITADNLANSIYSTLGSVEIYTNKTDAEPYQIYKDSSPEMNTGENNQWGEVLTQVLTGFTAGFYGTAGQPLNTQVSGTIDLNQNWNWDPTYAFGGNLAGDAPVYMDPYSKIFFFNSNSYGSGYSDNLMKQYSVGGPLISVYDSGLQANVGTIELTIYADGEQPQGYLTPVIDNYTAPGSGGYQTPVWNGDGTNAVLSFINQTMLLEDTTPIVFEIYAGEESGAPVWDQVTLASGTDVPLWQIWDITYDTATKQYGVTATGTVQPEGTLLLNNIPKAANGVAWYRIVVGSGDSQKVFNLYATTENSEILNPNYGDQAGSLAVDGLALATPESSTAETISTFSVNFLYSSATTLDPALLVRNTDPDFVATLATPNAPVVGTLSTSSVFTASAGQDSQVSNAVTVASAELAFGWTGLNSAAGTVSWISGYTNKVGALNAAQILFAEGSQLVLHPLTAYADIDGQWHTAAMQLGNGTYTVTMTEYLAADTAFSTPAGPASSPLTLTVDVAESALMAGSGGAGIALADAALPGNWIRLDTLSSSLPHEATLLLYAVDAEGRLVSRDGLHAGPGVTLEEATLGTLGAVPDDHGGTLFQGEQSVYLAAGLQLRFALLSGDGAVDEAPGLDILARPDGSLRLDVGGFELGAVTDNMLSDPAELAQSQRTWNQPWLYLQQGETLDVQVSGSCANTNTLGFVRIDVDPVTGDWSVAGVAHGAGAAFDAAVLGHLDSGLRVERGGDFDATLDWTVVGPTGYYAPVLLTQSGEVFVSGAADGGGHEYIRMYGENTFGFEDLADHQGSDFDYNDMALRITPVDHIL